MKRIHLPALLLLFVLWGCQSVPPAVPSSPAAGSASTPQPTQPDVNSITVATPGFSPLAQAPANKISFSLHFANPDKVKTWSVTFSEGNGNLVHTERGEAPRLPGSFTWDGTNDTGQFAPEGMYQARLTVDYGTGAPATADSDAFLVDITPPSGSVTVTPQPWEPGDPDIMVNPPLVTFVVNVVPGAAPVASWRLAVVHPDGRRFMDFISEDHRDNTVQWSGRSPNNASLEPGVTYDLVVQVFDRYGNTGTLKGNLAVAQAAPPVNGGPETTAQPAPVTVSVDGALVAATKVYFPPYSADLTKVDPSQRASNEQALDALARSLRSAGGTKIQVVGHANQIFWQDEAKGALEQKFVLIPLSKARAEAVRDAMVSRGLDETQFEVTGVGAEGALAPFGDSVHRWKNRRVEFVIQQVTP